MVMLASIDFSDNKPDDGIDTEELYRSFKVRNQFDSDEKYELIYNDNAHNVWIIWGDLV